MPEAKTLDDLFQGLLMSGTIKQSRLGPIKTALRQYARMLGYTSLDGCPASAYVMLDPTARNRFIDSSLYLLESPGKNGQRTLGSLAIRNLKNNLSFVFRTAVALGLVSDASGHLLSWKTATRNLENYEGRQESVRGEPYRIRPIPSQLQSQLIDYETWSTNTVNRTRPQRLRKRPVTFDFHRTLLLRIAGFLVINKGFNPEDLTLRTIVEPHNVMDYVDWYIEKQRRVTRGAPDTVSRCLAILHYLLIISKSPEEKAEIESFRTQLRHYRSTLGVPENVMDKGKRWLSIEALETVGCSIYPLNARRLVEIPRCRRATSRKDFNGRGYASMCLKSLMIRLLVRIPFRQRNIREMLWNPKNPESGQNLYRECTGRWHIRFSGSELKISHRRGEVNSIAHEFPDDLSNLLEEWLYKWRVVNLSFQPERYRGSERSSNGQEYVFLNYNGRPLNRENIGTLFKRATYKFTGVAVNPHMIRTIWATEYIKSTLNIVDAAYMLGDTVEATLRNYGRLLDEDCGRRAKEWVRRTLNHEQPVGGRVQAMQETWQSTLRVG